MLRALLVCALASGCFGLVALAQPASTKKRPTPRARKTAKTKAKSPKTKPPLPPAFVTTPNAPSGRGYSTEALERLCLGQKGVVVLDEAYVDFAGENAMRLALRNPHVLVARTFSKAYSLCFQRIGYFVGHPELIAALQKIRDSYNVNGLGQIAAEATLDDLAFYRANFRNIIATRDSIEPATGSVRISGLPEPDQFHPGPAAAVSREDLASAAARPEDPGALV